MVMPAMPTKMTIFEADSGAGLDVTMDGPDVHHIQFRAVFKLLTLQEICARTRLDSPKTLA